MYSIPVITGLDPVIHALFSAGGVDGRNEFGHDDLRSSPDQPVTTGRMANMSELHRFLDEARGLLPAAVALRRRIHQKPELGLDLPLTTAGGARRAAGPRCRDRPRAFDLRA